jgi:Fe-S cluster assembly iron-binding protein IscA
LDGKSTDWTLVNLKSSFASDIHPVQYTSKDGKHTSNCIPLMALLKSQAVPTEFKMDPSADPKRKNFNLRLAVVLQGADGYTMTFSLGELMPELGNKEAWIALDEDDKPLAERGGGLKLIVPGESMPARNVHSLVNIAVVDPSQLVSPNPATQPAAP